MSGWNEVLISGYSYGVLAVSKGGVSCLHGFRHKALVSNCHIQGKCKVVITAMMCYICVIVHRLRKNFKYVILLLQKSCEISITSFQRLCEVPQTDLRPTLSFQPFKPSQIFLSHLLLIPSLPSHLPQLALSISHCLNQEYTLSKPQQ